MAYTLGVLALGLLMLVVEHAHPGRKFERVPGWHARAITLNVAQAAMVWASTFAWNRWFPGFTLSQVGGHGLVIDAAIGYFSITFVYYWWHRARHEIPLLWRWLHQVHHSACS